jgi:hypothetical protein
MDDQPKPRRETKKSKGEKKQQSYSAKHIRIQQALKERKK